MIVLAPPGGGGEDVLGGDCGEDDQGGLVVEGRGRTIVVLLLEVKLRNTCLEFQSSTVRPNPEKARGRSDQEDQDEHRTSDE